MEFSSHKVVKISAGGRKGKREPVDECVYRAIGNRCGPINARQTALPLPDYEGEIEYEIVVVKAENERRS